MTERLHQRGDLLDLIDAALKGGTDQERKDLLAAAAQRIRDLNREYDAICSERGDVQRQLNEAGRFAPRAARAFRFHREADRRDHARRHDRVGEGVGRISDERRSAGIQAAAGRLIRDAAGTS